MVGDEAPIYPLADAPIFLPPGQPHSHDLVPGQFQKKASTRRRNAICIQHTRIPAQDSNVAAVCPGANWCVALALPRLEDLLSRYTCVPRCHIRLPW